MGVHEACRHALEHNLGLGPDESVLVVTDARRRALGEAFAQAAREVGARVEVDVIPVGERNGAEPPSETAGRMAVADVALLVTECSLSWTDARRGATSRGTRVASMPRLTEDILLRTLTIDYEVVRRRANRLCDRLDVAARVRVTSPAGTDLSFGVGGRVAHGRKGGLYREPGHWGNLPCGEAFIAPVEGTGEGVYVVDASQAGVGKLEKPIRVHVEAGRATQIDGGREAEQLRGVLAEVDDPGAYNLAEFGIGCNHAARITGVTLEDEKALGTCHLALGRNDLFGGTVRVGLHVDGVLHAPTVFVDDEPLPLAAVD